MFDATMLELARKFIRRNELYMGLDDTTVLRCYALFSEYNKACYECDDGYNFTMSQKFHDAGLEVLKDSNNKPIYGAHVGSAFEEFLLDLAKGM